MSMQKLKQIVSLVKPGSHPQQDLAILEDIIFKECTDAVAADSPFGRVLKGPEPRLSEGSKLPAALPVWQRVQLEKQKSFRLSNNRRLTTGCLQARASLHLKPVGYACLHILLSARPPAATFCTLSATGCKTHARHIVRVF